MPSITVPDNAALRAALRDSMLPYLTDLMDAANVFLYRPALEGVSPVFTIEHSGSEVVPQTPLNDRTTFTVALSLWVLRLGEGVTEQSAEDLHSQLERRMRQWFLDNRRTNAGFWLALRFNGFTNVVEFLTEAGAVYLLEEWTLLARVI